MKRMNYVVNKAKVAGIIAAAALVMAPVCVMADEAAAPVSVETEVQAEDTAAASTVDVTAPTSSEDTAAPAASEDQAASATGDVQADAVNTEEGSVVNSKTAEEDAEAKRAADDAYLDEIENKQIDSDYYVKSTESHYDEKTGMRTTTVNAHQGATVYEDTYTERIDDGTARPDTRATFETDNGGWYQVKEYVLWGRQVTGKDDSGAFTFGPWEKVVVKSGGNIKQELGKHYDEYAFDLDVMWGTDHPYSNVFWRAEDGNAENIKISWGGAVRSVDVDIDVNGRNIYHETNCASHSAFNGN